MEGDRRPGGGFHFAGSRQVGGVQRDGALVKIVDGRRTGLDAKEAVQRAQSGFRTSIEVKSAQVDAVFFLAGLPSRPAGGIRARATGIKKRQAAGAFLRVRRGSLSRREIAACWPHRAIGPLAAVVRRYIYRKCFMASAALLGNAPMHWHWRQSKRQASEESGIGDGIVRFCTPLIESHRITFCCVKTPEMSGYSHPRRPS